jgi:hypothetical protein
VAGSMKPVGTSKDNRVNARSNKRIFFKFESAHFSCVFHDINFCLVRPFLSGNQFFIDRAYMVGAVS